VWDQTTGKLTDKGRVRYYMDHFDISDRKHPRIRAKINTPGMLVGGSEADPSVLFFVDYRWWDDGYAHDEFAVAKRSGDKVYLQSTMNFPGYVGSLFVRGSTAYTSIQDYGWYANQGGTYTAPKVTLHEIDLADPKHPADHPAQAQKGWGWLLGVEGDRALVTSGWGQQGLDIYRLHPGMSPTFDQFARTRGWWTNAVARQDQTIFLSTGYWGVQAITLNK
jgi:hypothetical protein